MGRIFVTGDTHALLDINKLIIFNANHPELTKDDLLIVCGDFGAVWNEINKELIDVYEEFHFSTAFVVGNHEGYDLLETLEKEIWNSGMVRRLSDSVVQLMNGNSYDINGQTFLVMGGAASTDKEWRIPHESWWPQEIPSLEERNLCLLNTLAIVVDNIKPIILTHTAPSKMVRAARAEYRVDEYTDFLQNLYNFVNYKHWYCGHFHTDMTISNFTFLYDNIIEIM